LGKSLRNMAKKRERLVCLTTTNLDLGGACLADDRGKGWVQDFIGQELMTGGTLRFKERKNSSSKRTKQNWGGKKS